MHLRFVPFLTLSLVAVAGAQRTDTTRVPVLDATVSVADRAPTPLRATSAAVVRLSGADVAAMPRATLADVLRLIPGIALVSFDGLGFDPAIMTRGFYGGGEADYVVVLVDGRPVNQLHTGLVPWDALPPASSIEAVEVVRGSSSSLYGDAAVGGVVNIITRSRAGSPRPRWEAMTGSHSTTRAALDLPRVPVITALALSADLNNTGGYRAHAERAMGSIRGRWGMLEGVTSLWLDGSVHWRSFDDPGPLLQSAVDSDRRGSDPLFRFDHTDDDRQTLSLNVGTSLGAARLTGVLSREHRSIEATRTLALAPGFGDTRDRDAVVNRTLGTVQAEIANTPLPGADRWVIGVEGTHGALRSTYYAFTGGTSEDYAAASPTRGTMDNESRVTRTAGAAFAHLTLQPTAPLRLTLGMRLDLTDDHRDADGGIEGSSRSHSATSPKVGINYSYGSGNLYLSASRSFKAPTLDQRYDRRPIPVPFPPFSLTTSNASLSPQTGTSIEGGVYHETPLRGGRRLSLSASAYRIDMRDEIDFDVASLSYVNIGRSRHDGIELGVTGGGPRASLAVAYGLQDVTAQAGPAAGNQLKAIPRHSLTTTLSAAPRERVGLALVAIHAGGAYLDDANDVPLDSYTRIDGRLTLRGPRGGALLVELRNLFDARYSTTGFMDPAGTGAVYLHPAAGRTIHIGLERGW
jgi:outer membrane receptor protein involved in Fe transport